LIVPITIVVLGVDYAIQALFRYRQERDKGFKPPEALGNSTYRVGRALVLAMGTTIVAFGSNASSGIESVIGFAIAASFAIFASLVILGLFVPAVNMKWRASRKTSAEQHAKVRNEMTGGGWLGRSVIALSDRWFITLPVILIITAFAGWGWTEVETKFDAKDALKPDSDFVVSLDKWDVHGADMGGEPSYLYFEGDLTQQKSLDAIKATIDEMDDNQYIGRNPTDNRPNVHVLLLELLEVVVENDYVQNQIHTASGVEITDIDGDLIPDTPDQLRAVYDYVLEYGLPQDETTMRYTTKQIPEMFVQLDADTNNYATLLSIGIPGTREQEISRNASTELNHDLDAALANVDSITRYGLSGSADVRVVQFDAIADALSMSLILAIAAVIMLLLIVFRSIRYAIITIIPVILVACWLYGFMYLAGYSLNMLTATIAAISIGMGIDFSIHFTERFREELSNGNDKRSALRITAETTGLALFSAALTTVVGFTVIAFAPMPMFSTFGILTAIMIALSLLMALFALPSLLYAFAPKASRKE
ncbi:MAG: MMPL family transporter, partial [Chloroflexi bacterium]|nr:MMPL family transporter [Chloroflexota bacterium]